MSIAAKEACESRYWLHLSRDGKVLAESQVAPLIDNIEEIIRILTSIVLDEIQAGDQAHAANRMEQAADLGVLAVNQATLELAQLYLDRG